MPKKRIDVEMVEVRARIPKPMFEQLESLIGAGAYADISEVLRDGIRMLLANIKERGLIK